MWHECCGKRRRGSSTSIFADARPRFAVVQRTIFGLAVAVHPRVLRTAQRLGSTASGRVLLCNDSGRLTEKFTGGRDDTWAWRALLCSCMEGGGWQQVTGSSEATAIETDSLLSLLVHWTLSITAGEVYTFTLVHFRVAAGKATLRLRFGVWQASTWATLRCLAGPPSREVVLGAKKLNRPGVSIGLFSLDLKGRPVLCRYSRVSFYRVFGLSDDPYYVRFINAAHHKHNFYRHLTPFRSLSACLFGSSSLRAWDVLQVCGRIAFGD